MNADELKAMLAEDERRRREHRQKCAFDPLRGEESDTRVLVSTPEDEVPEAWIPRSMTEDSEYVSARADALRWRVLRCRHDFAYWCYRCVRIKPKDAYREVPFVLNAPQRKVLGVLESDRLAGRPIRLILLKARQWGGSTLVQTYMAWIQCCHRHNWNSLICAHVKDIAASIRGMYSKLLAGYPEELWEGDAAPAFRPFERSMNVRRIEGRGCNVTVGSAENQDAVRGSDYAMAHLSETAFWRASRQHSPADFIRAVCGSVALLPYTLVVMESTANGVGNYFHAEWLRCKSGQGDKHAVFVAWYEIEMYSCPPPDREAFAASLNEYEYTLWLKGIDLDRIYWYHCKAREYASVEQLHAEFPSDDVEAFINTGSGVFSNAAVEALRPACSEIQPRVGEISGEEFKEDSRGAMKMWKRPEPGRVYVVAVDVGGRSAVSDWSVVAVMAVGGPGQKHEFVAQWRGHCDHDLLARRAADIARYYNTALLLIESNTLETADYAAASSSSLFVLNRLAEEYPNMYMRQSFDTCGGSSTLKVGFHTNRSTKHMLVSRLIEAVREGEYIERDTAACDELITYEQRPNGTFAAKEGYHDDILMTRAMALFAADSEQCVSVPPDVLPYSSPW